MAEHVSLTDAAIHTYRRGLERMEHTPVYPTLRLREAVEDAAVAGLNRKHLHDIEHSVKSYVLGRSEEQQGWALKWSRGAVRFTTKQKEFLRTRFEAGVSTGIKFNPTETAQDMRRLRSPNGTAYFEPTEYLTWQQIASFWSRMSANPRSGNRQQAPDEVTPDEYIRDPTIHSQHADIREELENGGLLNVTNATDAAATTEATSVNDEGPPTPPPPGSGRKRARAGTVRSNDRPDQMGNAHAGRTPETGCCAPGPSKKQRTTHDELFF